MSGIDGRRDMLDFKQLFSVKKLQEVSDLQTFSSEYPEYTSFLLENARIMDDAMITQTYLVIEKASGKIVAYFSVLPGSVSIDKSLKGQFPELVFPSYADKLGTLHVHHLAGDALFCSEYKHVIRFIMDYLRALVVYELNSFLRIGFISLDADINTDENIDKKYESAGFKQVGMSLELPLMLLPVYE
jgi:hypothetical protein